MYILWGIITTIITILFEFIMMQVPFSLHTKSLSFFIPAGGFIDGVLCASGVYLYLRIKSLRLKPKHFICGGLITFVGFWSIYFMSYETAYVSDGRINHSFKGEKISNYMYNHTEQFTFDNYLHYGINKTRFTSYDYLGSIKKVDDFGYTFNTAVFISECIGFCLGGIVISVIAFKNRNNCRKCRNIYSKKRLYAFKTEYVKDEIKEIQKSFNSKDDFKAFIYKNREPLKNQEDFIEVSLKYCNDCNIGYIEYKHMKLMDKVKNEKVWAEDKDKYIEIEIPRDKLKRVTETNI